MESMLDSQDSISSLEITKNPFESVLEDKTNYPGFSPSMFVHQKTPVNDRKKKEFRWSIEQISRLYPADMDEFPNQEYSSTYERPEDEKAAQQAIEEYFSQDAIVPSPWTPNRSAKKVTFSPLPPDTQYIPGNDCSFDSTFSQNGSINVKKTDACTQTLWSIPLNAVSLDEILGKAFENLGHNTSDDGKNLSNSSLRRNLFPIDENTHTSTDQNNNQPTHQIRSILKASKSPIMATSSPLSSKKSPEAVIEKNRSPGTPYLDVSPIKISPLNKLKHKAKDLNMSSCNVLESSGMESDLKMFPDISPIKDINHENNDEISGNIMSTSDEDSMEESSIIQASDNDDMEKRSLNDDDDDDDDKPAKITMEDLASDDDNDDKSRNDNNDYVKNDDDDDDEKPAMITMEDLAPDDDDDNNDLPPSVTMDDLSVPSNNDPTPPDLTAEDLSIPAQRENQSDDQKNETQPEMMETSMIANPPSLYQRDLTLSDLSYVNKPDSFHTQKHYNELDEDLVIMKAAAAIRRANRFKSNNDFNSDKPLASTKSDISMMSMNVSEIPWQPVIMSTPVPTRDRAYGSSFDHELDNRDWIGRSKEFDGTGSCCHDSSKRLSPVMEDVIRRQGILKATLREVQSEGWMDSSPGKWRAPRSYPLSNVERKILYGKPTRIPDYVDYFSPQLYKNDVGSTFESKRTSWPPTYSFSPRYSTRPLSPTSLPKKVYSKYPEESVSRMPIPDSGFDEWKKTINRHEKSMKLRDIKLRPFYY